jgi:hypothetical protein
MVSLSIKRRTPSGQAEADGAASTRPKIACKAADAA